MLTISIPESEFFNDETSEFVQIPPYKLKLEHSLLSISKWESKWCKPFLVKRPPKTTQETIDYIRCMTIGPTPDPIVYYSIPKSEMDKIEAYIEAPMTATTFNSQKEGQRYSRQIITSEIIYYDMCTFGIPFECEKWHLNRLLTLIRVCAIKNQPQKKMSKEDVRKRYNAVNARRRAQTHSKG